MVRHQFHEKWNLVGTWFHTSINFDRTGFHKRVSSSLPNTHMSRFQFHLPACFPTFFWKRKQREEKEREKKLEKPREEMLSKSESFNASTAKGSP